MKFDFHLLILLCIVGVVYKRLNGKGWLAVGLLIFSWIMYNWFRH